MKNGVTAICPAATSATFSVPLDDQWHDYSLSLRGIAAWSGTTDRLRLDPVDLAGVALALDELRLLGE